MTTTSAIHRVVIAAAIVALLAASANAALTLTGPLNLNRSANLLQNGSFEDHPSGGMPPYFWATGTASTPFATPGFWTSSGDIANYSTWGDTAIFRGTAALPHGNSGLYFGNGLMAGISPSPTFNTDGSVTFSSFPVLVPKATAPVTLSQTLTGLNTSATYGLTFWVSGEDAANASFSHDGIMGLDVTGYNTVYLAVPSGQSALGSSHVYNFTFNPTTPNTTITFTNWGHPVGGMPGWSYPGTATELAMDDVIVNQVVPEPGTLPLLGAGCLGLLALAWKRNRRKVAFASVVVALLTCVPPTVPAVVIDFETNPGGGTPMDDAPLTAPYNIVGGGTAAFFFDDNGSNAYDPGIDTQPVFEAYGPDGLDGFANGFTGMNDTANGGLAGQLGNFFLRQPQPGTVPPPFIVDYNTSQIITALSGEIWDIDGGPTNTEQWKVEALDGLNNLLASQLSPLGISSALDGLPWVFSFSGLPSGFDKVRITFVGSKAEGLGLAFNNFDPTSSAVPEPGTLVLALAGAVAMLVASLRRKILYRRTEQRISQDSLPISLRRTHMTRLFTSISSVRRAALAVLALIALVSCCGSAALAVSFDFLSVSGNSTPGNAASTTFTSNVGNGTIKVTHFFPSAGGWGTFDNDNAAIYPSQFTTLFPGTGLVQGHLAMTQYGTTTGGPNTSQVVFDLTGYTGFLPNLVFGIWNTTDEVALPAYNVQLLNSSSLLVAPTTFNLVGNQDNQTQVAGRHKMQLNALTGDITAPLLINAGGTHTDAMFFDGIPTGTKQIIVTARLGPLNSIGDGVGYYFAEPVPEPSTLALLGIGAVGLLGWWRRRKRVNGGYCRQ